jgi:hypothetical protein
MARIIFVRSQEDFENIVPYNNAGHCLEYVQIESFYAAVYDPSRDDRRHGEIIRTYHPNFFVLDAKFLEWKIYIMMDDLRETGFRGP